MFKKVIKARKFQGEIALPGDKSISHRSMMLSAICEGETRIENYSPSADCASTRACMQAMGVFVESDNTEMLVRGAGKFGLLAPRHALDCGNSGTTMRLLSGILAGQTFSSELIGDESLSKRPMKRIITPLVNMKAAIRSREGFAPLQIRGNYPLDAFEHKLTIPSAQIKSAILFAGLYAEGKTVIFNPQNNKKESASRDHTERMLRHLGAEVTEEYVESSESFVQKISIEGNSVLKAADILIPADISAAAFFIVGAMLYKGAEISLPNVGLNKSRTALLGVLQKCGAKIEIRNRRNANLEEIGDVYVYGDPESLTSERVRIGAEVVPNLIDEIPILAVLGSQLKGGIEIREAEELRVKESDRIRSVVENLKKMGAEVEEFRDGMLVSNSSLRGNEITTYGDHRIAMAFAIAASFARGETVIDNSDCAAVSFPKFFSELEKITL
ncbi:MAG: 3-phosphoshikimate 1-carboxyvinyltransferase [Pyrinomonadaceae bacterium]